MKFKLSSVVDSNKVFLVQRHELEGRIDPCAYCPERAEALRKIKKSKFGCEKIKLLSSFLKNSVEEINVWDTYVGLENVESDTGFYIKSDSKESVSSAFIFKRGQVLFPKLRPYLNKVFYAPFDGICSTEFHILDSHKINNQYLAVFLGLNIVVKQTSALMSGNTLPRLQTEDIKNLLIPVPPKHIQNKIVKKMEAAYTLKKQKEAEAATLLDSIDDYLMSELGITLPAKEENTVQNRIFSRHLSDISGGRFDAEYYQKKYHDINSVVKGSYEVTQLCNLLKVIESGSRPQGGVANIPFGVLSFGGEHINDNCEVEIKNPKYIPDYFHMLNKKTETQLGDILLVKDGATTGKVGIVTNNEHVEKNINEHLFLLRVNRYADPVYLVSYLYSYIGQLQIKKEITGATVTGVTRASIAKLKIIIPPLPKQKEIASRITKIRNKAKQLREQARRNLENAKKEVEQMIIG